MNVQCAVFGHHRSAKEAHLNPSSNRWESYCTRCGEKLVRVAHGRWVLAEKLEDA